MKEEGDQPGASTEGLQVRPAAGTHPWHSRLVRLRHDPEELLDEARLEKMRQGTALHKALQAVSPEVEIPEIFKPYFALVPDARVFTEMEIADEEGGVFRIDRLIVTDTEVRVADIKTGTGDPGKDREQVARYLKLLRQIHPGKRVRGVLLYWDALKVEAVE